MVFVNNNVRTYENLYIRKIKIRNILETKYSRFTVCYYTYILYLLLQPFISPHFYSSSHSQRGHFKVVPILVGALKPEKESEYGQILTKYLLDQDNLFIVSSDFCHWGKSTLVVSSINLAVCPSHCLLFVVWKQPVIQDIV